MCQLLHAFSILNYYQFNYVSELRNIHVDLSHVIPFHDFPDLIADIMENMSVLSLPIMPT